MQARSRKPMQPARDKQAAENGGTKRRRARKPQVPLTLQLLRTSLRSLDRLSPGLAGRWAYRLWFSTHRFAEPGREARWREQAQQSTLPHAYGPLTVYSWGTGPAVLLVHGWNGRGTQLGAFAAPLVEAGCRAVAFDAPAHGRTPGNSTTLFRFVDAAVAVAAAVGPLQGIVTHSFGALVIARALSTRLSARRVVCISPPAGLDFLIENFSTTLGIPTRTRQVFVQLLERDFGDDIWTQVSAESNAAQLSIPALVIHDEDDTDVPWQQGERLAAAWPDAQFVRTRGLGHRRILRHRETVRTAVDFIARSNEGPRGAGIA